MIFNYFKVLRVMQDHEIKLHESKKILANENLNNIKTLSEKEKKLIKLFRTGNLKILNEVILD